MSGEVAVGGDLVASTAKQFVFDTSVKVAKVTMAPTAAVGVYGRWNTDTAALTDFEFYLGPGESEWSPPCVRVKSVTLIASSGLTYETDFSVRGYHKIN